MNLQKKKEAKWRQKASISHERKKKNKKKKHEYPEQIKESYLERKMRK